jgi:hypothetical protein
MTGFAWALFHVQKQVFIGPMLTTTAQMLMLVYMTDGTVVFSWIYLHTAGSMLLVVLTHMGVYLNNSAQALPDTTPLAIHTLGFCRWRWPWRWSIGACGARILGYCGDVPRTRLADVMGSAWHEPGEPLPGVAKTSKHSGGARTEQGTPALRRRRTLGRRA